jgi:hypothetical protein
VPGIPCGVGGAPRGRLPILIGASGTSRNRGKRSIQFLEADGLKGNNRGSAVLRATPGKGPPQIPEAEGVECHCPGRKQSAKHLQSLGVPQSLSRKKAATGNKDLFLNL